MIRAQTCGVCNKELGAGAAAEEFFPFCSERCRNIDLYRWTQGQYAIIEPLDEEHLQLDDDGTQSEEL